MIDVTEAADRRSGRRVWICVVCGLEYDEPDVPPPPVPGGSTDALPGSPEKVAVLEERSRLGLSLWHPGDARVLGRLPSAQTGGGDTPEQKAASKRPGRGVYRHRRGYKARVWLPAQKRYKKLGYYRTAQEAAAAVEAAEAALRASPGASPAE